MRIISYNILDGGEGRADPLAEVIEAQRPDVVALVEADDLAVVERIANRLKMDFVHAPGNSHASALLSHWPIVASINHGALRPELSRSLLEATLRDPKGALWPIGVLHLYPHALEVNEQARERELAVVLEIFRPYREQRQSHILAGDFNANSPHQKIDPARCYKTTRQEWQANGGQIPRRAVQQLLDAGYTDALHAVLGDAATNSGTFTTQHPGQRVDYIFTHGVASDRLRHAWIEQHRLARYASDHFPIGLEIG